MLSRLVLMRIAVALGVALPLLAGDSGENAHTPSSELFYEFNKNNDSFELGRITKVLSNMDALFAKAFVKVQKLGPNDELLPETLMSLYDFISGSMELNEIKLRLKSELPWINLDEKTFVEEVPKSYFEALKILCKKKIITPEELYKTQVSNGALRPEELSTLIENGAVRTKKGFLIQLRTGTSFGHALELSDTMIAALREAEKKSGKKIPDAPLMELLDGPFRQYLLEAFSHAGFYGTETLSDAHVLSEMRKYFIFVTTIGRINWLQPTAFTSGVNVNETTATTYALNTNGLSAMLMSNYYLSGTNSSINQGFAVNPLGLSYATSWSFQPASIDGWLTYSDGFLGGGGDFTVNIDQGWSNSNSSYLLMGLYAGGWKNNITLGASLQALLANGIGAGASAQISIARSHTVAYLGPYAIDGKIVAIRGLHKIEINDLKGRGFALGVAANFTPVGVPLSVAFRAGANFTHTSIFRTHTDLGTAKEMLHEGNLPGLLYLAGNKIIKTRAPSFLEPEKLIDGDELLETKTGTLSGAFVIGLQSLAFLSAARVGASIDMSAEFELGLKRLPNNKFEVSIAPRRIYEMSIFGSVLNLLGAGQVRSISLARKQIYLFDFSRKKAREAYYTMVHQGILPSVEDIEISMDEHGPEYLLSEFRAQNKIIKKKGVERIYLEKIKIDTSKTYAGVNSPLIPALFRIINKAHNKARKDKKKLHLRFEGIDREFMTSQARTVATNGLISVKRTTSGWRKSKGQGFSGRYTEDLFITHRKVFSVEELPSGLTRNIWQFDSLVIHSQLQDTVITGDEENEMVKKINALFRTFVGSFEQKNTKAPRIVNLERELTRRELAILTSKEAEDRIAFASQVSGISQNVLYFFLRDLKNKHNDQQAKLIKKFIHCCGGLEGFSAIHQLLGGKADDLTVLTDSSYRSAINKAKTFLLIANDSTNKSSDDRVDFNASKSQENRKKIKSFYIEARANLREIDYQLRLLYDDQYLIDDKSLLNSVLGTEKVEELIKNGRRQNKVALKTALVSARFRILKLMDLAAQGFSLKDRLIIYKMAKLKHLRFVDQIEYWLAEAEYCPLYTEKLAISHKRLWWDLLNKIKERLAKLEKDEVMKTMDKEYVIKQMEVLAKLKLKVEKLLIDNFATKQMN